jgi:hypothetical protein
VRVNAPPNSVPLSRGGATERSVSLAELLQRLTGYDELAGHLVDVLVNRREGPLGCALRQDRAVRFEPTPTEALGLLLSQLCRDAPGEALHLAPLRKLGPDGARAAVLLERALDEPHPPVSARAMAQLIDAAVASVPWMEGTVLQPRLKAAAAVRPATASFEDAASRPVPVTLGEGSRVAPGTRLDQLLPGLAYAGGALGEELGRLLNAAPPSRLAQALVDACPSAPLDEPSQLAALLRTLWRYRRPLAKEAFELDEPQFRHDFGAEAEVVLTALRRAEKITVPDRPNYVGMARIVDALAAMGSKEEVLPLVRALVRGPGLIPRSLPALDAVAAQIPDDALKGCGVVGAQHLLTNTVPLVEMFLQKGMEPRHVQLHGTPYNNNPLVISYLKLLGVGVTPGQDNLGSTRFIKELKLQELEHFVGQVCASERPPRGWTLLDDGGLLQKVISGAEGSSYGHARPDPTLLRWHFDPASTLAVEQTTRGLTEVPNPSCPTVAVARAEGKKREGKVIGWALADSLVLELKQRGKDLRTARTALVGAGTIGLEAALQLRACGLDVCVVDLDPAVRARAEAEGFRAFLRAEDALGEVNVVLSCTGRNIWSGSTLARWDGLLLSGSSMAAEFDVDQIDAFRSSQLKVGNRGRPLNFHGDGHAVLDPDEIGITLALLFLGVAQQSLKGGAAGYYDVDAALEDIAIAAWEASGGTTTRTIALKERSAPPPDELTPDGTASHDVWMSYLSSLRRKVFPPPNSVRGEVPVYFFKDDLGCVRLIDTRKGRSVVVPLPDVPDEGFPLSQEGSRYFVAVGEPPQPQQAWLMDLASEAPSFETVGQFDRLVATYVRDQTSLSGGPRKLDVGVALEGEKELWVLEPGAAQFRSYPKPLGSNDSKFVWRSSKVLLQVQRDPARVGQVELGDRGSSPGGAISLPPEMVTVEAVARWPQQVTAIALGRTAEGRVIVSPLVEGPLARRTPPVLLPEGATFRGLRPAEDGKYLHFLVDYTLPEDAAELSSYRQAVLDLLADVG